MMLSIIIPIYNSEGTLQRCLDSLLEQGVDEYEIICVDDGSTDNSAVLLEDYQKRFPEFIKIHHQENAGVSSARNLGLEVAKGDVVAFCDADDYLIPKAYGYLLENFWSEDLDVLSFYSVTLDDVMLKSWKEKNELEGKTVFKGNGKDFYRSFLPAMVWHALYRKRFLDRFNLRFGEQRYAEDIEFCMNLYMQNPRCSVVSSNVYRYTVSKSQLTRIRKPDMMRSQVKDLIHLMGEMNEHSSRDDSMASCFKTYKSNIMLSCMSRILSANYSKKEWTSVKESLHRVSAIPLDGTSLKNKVINSLIEHFLFYKIVGVFYRSVFIPFILPHLSRN